MFLPHPRVKVSIVGSLRDREVACSASDRQGSNFESCVRRTLSSQLSHHPQEVILAQFSLCVHKGGLKPDSFHFFEFTANLMQFSLQQITSRYGHLIRWEYQFFGTAKWPSGRECQCLIQIIQAISYRSTNVESMMRQCYRRCNIIGSSLVEWWVTVVSISFQW